MFLPRNQLCSRKSRDDGVIYLPLVTRRHSTNMMQLVVAYVKFK